MFFTKLLLTHFVLINSWILTRGASQVFFNDNSRGILYGCGPTERWQNCRFCDATCYGLPRDCFTDCVPGCSCKMGYVRIFSPRYACIDPGLCPNRDPGVLNCDAKEEFSQTGSCDKTCFDLHKPCPQVNAPGCYCRPGHVRRSDIGSPCIPMSDCPSVPDCPPNERWSMCSNCDDTNCGQRFPMDDCPTDGVCIAGCVCQRGFVRAVADNSVTSGDGKAAASNCVPESHCYVTPTCGMNERYSTCIGCTMTCDLELPKYCPSICISGCECKEHHVRDKFGRCIPKDQCPIRDPVRKRCPMNSDWKVCGSVCQPSCAEPNPICMKTCSPGCYCRAGFVVGPNNECIMPSDCPKEMIEHSKPTIMIEHCTNASDKFPDFCARVRQEYGRHACTFKGFGKDCSLTCCFYRV